jgi:2',3'-cyclic-nucleotide 2'-phosphodiesterase (5'-nucleotidase family)
MYNLSRALITVLLILSASVAHGATFRVIYINDFHGFANPVTAPGSKQQLGGAAALAARLKVLRAEKPGIFVAAGDIIQGDSWANLSQGASAIKLMNHLQLDAMVTGNHEFDFGQDQLRQRIKEARFPVLAANVSGMNGTSPRVYFNRPGGRIAVIGLVTPDVPQTSHPKNTKGLKFSPVLETAKEQISEAEITASLIVLLTHIGHENDRALAEELCKNQPESDVPILIVGGHSHTKVEKPVQIGNCVVVQAWEHGKALGVVDLTIEKGKLLAVDGRLEQITPAGAIDQETAALVDRYNQRINKLLGKKAGVTKVDLFQEGVRRQETNLGNLVADVVRKTTGAQVALVNGGSIRSGIPKGEITRRQIYATLPFNNYLVAVRMTGKQLLESLEHGVSDIEHEEGRFPQVSGIRFSFNRHKPAGQRVTSLYVGDAPLDLQKEYTVATLDFIAAGGDGYMAFGEAIRSAGDFNELNGSMQSSRLVYNNPGYFLRDAVLEMLSTGGPVSATVEGRITGTP